MIFNFALKLELIFSLLCLVLSDDMFNSVVEDQTGRVPIIDELINQPDILKAITFSVNYKDSIFKDVLTEAIESINHKIKDLNSKEEKRNAKHYVYVLKNVKKYTSRWLSEEIQQLMIRTNEHKSDMSLTIKKNIAEYIYFSASDFGVNLVLEGKDISLKDWKKRHDLKLRKNHSDEL